MNDKMKDSGFKTQKPKVDCPICHKLITNNLGLHIREKHGEEEFRRCGDKTNIRNLAYKLINSLIWW